jgi:hypothetical protein
MTTGPRTVYRRIGTFAPNRPSGDANVGRIHVERLFGDRISDLKRWGCKARKSIPTGICVCNIWPVWP